MNGNRREALGNEVLRQFRTIKILTYTCALINKLENEATISIFKIITDLI